MITCDRSQPRHYGDEAGRYWSVSQVIEVIRGPVAYSDQSAMQRGTDIHEVFALALAHRMGWSEEPSVYADYAGYYQAILAWADQSDPRPMRLERSLRHKTYPYAGTVDFVGMLGQDYGVLDLKTGVPAKWHSLQLHAYQKMLDKAAKMWILYIKPDGTFKQVSVKPSARHWAAFHNGLSILQWRESE